MKSCVSWSLFVFMCVVFSCPAQETKRPASEGTVIVLEKLFEIPELGRTRQLRIYLPPGYAQSTNSYPVMYMHDGQNLFDAATSYSGEWGVDENLNSLSKEEGLDVIAVGIDNGQEHRNTELIPWANERIGEPEGKAYMTFVVEVVKPYIDKHYRTKSERQNTAIVGSSLGGLISHYALYAYPEVFSMAGILSPSYWVSDEVYAFTENNPVPADSRLYLLVGGKEGMVMTEPLKKMHRLIVVEGHPIENVTAKINPEGEHNEKFWNGEFQEVVKWLFKRQ